MALLSDLVCCVDCCLEIAKVYIVVPSACWHGKCPIHFVNPQDLMISLRCFVIYSLDKSKISRLERSMFHVQLKCVPLTEYTHAVSWMKLSCLGMRGEDGPGHRWSIIIPSAASSLNIFLLL